MTRIKDPEVVDGRREVTKKHVGSDVDDGDTPTTSSDLVARTDEFYGSGGPREGRWTGVNVGGGARRDRVDKRGSVGGAVRKTRVREGRTEW